jgi:hypothetical protein
LLHTKRRLVAKQGGFFVPPLHVILNVFQDPFMRLNRWPMGRDGP